MFPEGCSSHPGCVAVGFWFNVSSQHLKATVLKTNTSFRANVLQNYTRRTYAQVNNNTTSGVYGQIRFILCKHLCSCGWLNFPLCLANCLGFVEFIVVSSDRRFFISG